MKNICFYLLVSIILTPFVLANYQYVNYGGGGYDYGVSLLPYTLFGSNQYEGTVTTGVSFNTVSIDRLPIITNPQDSFSSTSSNYVFLFDASNIYAFDNYFNAVSFLPLSGNTGGLNVIPYPDDSSDLHFIGLYEEGLGSDIKIYNFSFNSFNLEKEVFITNRSYQGEAYAGKLAVAYIPDSSNNFTRVNLISNSSIFFDAPYFNMTSCTVQEKPVYGNNFIVDDFNLDGYDDIAQIGKIDANKVMISLFNTRTGTYFFKKNVTGITNSNYCSISSGVIGGSGKKIISYVHGTGASANTANVNVFDLNGNLLLSTSSAAATETIYPSIVDFNIDGNNELIIQGSSVYNSAFGLIGVIATGDNPFGVSRTPTNAARLISFGRFSTSSIMEIVTARGMYIPNQTAISGSRWIKTFDFANNSFFNNTLVNYSFNNDSNGVIVADVVNKLAKDILVMSETGATALFMSNFGGNICGDGICGFGETQLTCPADCSPASPSDAVLTTVNIDPCNTVTWLKNTSVKITAIAESTGLEPMTITADFCKDCFSSCEQTAFQTVPNGGLASFMFIANCTGTDMYIQVSADKPNQVSPDVLTFPYIVDPNNGFEMGDGECGVTQPLQYVNHTSNLTGSIVNNGLTNSVAYFSLLTGLSGLILWLIAMTIVTLAIIFGCAYAHFPPMIMMGCVILVNILMLSIGTFLKLLPISFVIITALGLVVVVGLWFRGQLTGSSGS